MSVNRKLYERGTILTMLQQNRGLEWPIAFMPFLRALHLINLPLAPQGLREHLEYLSQRGYVALTRREDLPGYRTSGLRTDERPDQIMLVKLTARAMDLIEGTISDEGVFI